MSLKTRLTFSLFSFFWGAFFSTQVVSAGLDELCYRTYYIQGMEANADYSGLVVVDVSTDPLGKENLVRGTFATDTNDIKMRAQMPLIMTAMNMKYPVRFYCGGGDLIKSFRVNATNNFFQNH